MCTCINYVYAFNFPCFSIIRLSLHQHYYEKWTEHSDAIFIKMSVIVGYSFSCFISLSLNEHSHYSHVTVSGYSALRLSLTLLVQYCSNDFLLSQHN